MATDTRMLISSFESIFGSKSLGAYDGFLYHPAAHYAGSRSQVYLVNTNNSVESLRAALVGNGLKVKRWAGREDKVRDVLSYRLHRREETPTLCTILPNGFVTDFPNKNSVFRVGAKALGSDVLKEFDANVDSLSANMDDFRWPGMTWDVFVNILNETRAYLVSTLKAVNVPATDENVAGLAELIHMKTYRVIKESLTAMPYLKTEREVDKSLAVLVGMGMNYRRFLIFNVSEFYPETREDFDQYVNAPDDWLVALSF